MITSTGHTAQRSTLRAHILATLALASSMLASAPVTYAQQATGSIYGSANAGATVVIKSQDTGLTREVSADASGKFEFANLPTGNYTVTIQEGPQAGATQTARVNPGVGTSVSFTAQLSEVVVTGVAVSPIDTSTAQVSTTFSAEALKELPLPLDIINVALLAPGTTQGDARFGNLAAFGGSSVAENSYYINGFNVTNLFQNLSYAQLPFYAIGSEQVITGGYGPEFGMSTGGVVNIVTKKGTNKLEGGAAITWAPDSLRGTSPRTYTPTGLEYRDYSNNTNSETTYDAWLGGAIVQDKLFFFLSGEFTKEDRLTHPNDWFGGNVVDISTKKPFVLLNVDWNINDRNLLAFTYIHDQRKFEEHDYAADYSLSNFSAQGSYLGTDFTKQGGNIFFLKYNGNLTDDFSVTAQVGKLKSDRSEYQVTANGVRASYNGVIGDYNQPGCPLVLYTAAWIALNPGAPRPSCWLTTSIATENGEDERKAGRVDFEYRVPIQLAGAHKLGFGYEVDKWSTFYGESYAGGTYYRYQTAAANTVSRVRVRHFQTGADVGVDTKAAYLKDDWQITDNLLVQLGVRSDTFQNLNGNGAVYVEQTNIIQPRIAAAWDVSGNSSKKLYGSFGIYSLPIAATVAVRGASASIFSQQTFTYTGITPVTGVPTGLAPAGALLYLNNENGLPLDPDSVASKTLDSTEQEEFVLGYQMEFANNWKGGIRATYRNLKKTIDDICDSRPFENWAIQHGRVFDPTNLPGCMMINPGYAIDANVDVDADGVKEFVHLSPADVGLPRAMRKYYAVELSLEKLWRDNWYTQMSYTWAHNYGNAEGLVKSDIGQDDTGVTQDFDFPELMRGAYGDLPNDRRHSFKLLGAYKPIDGLTLSSNVLIQTGRPRNCFGLDAVTDANFGYGASYFYCNGVVVPRGSIGRTDTIFNLDLAAAYAPNFAPGLTMKVAVFNVLDRHGVNYYQEAGEESTGAPDAGFGTPQVYQRPRYVQFTFEYAFGGRRE